MSSQPILVTGGTGQIGGAVARLAALRGIEIVLPDRHTLDLCDDKSISAAISNNAFSAVINCAAYTAVDKAENDAELAYKINSHAPAIIACETARAGIPLIHVSTDYVFDGAKVAPYVEADAVNPINVYGETKEAGESAVRALSPKHAIIRTGWVLSASGANFLNTLLRVRTESAEMGVVNDRRGNPTSADHVAAALLTVATELEDRRGTWHFVNSGKASWYDLAAHIFEEVAKHGLATPKLRAISTAQYPTLAKRPANSCLNTAAIEDEFSIKPRPWQEAVDAVLIERLNR